MKAKLLTALLIIGCFSIPAFAEYQLFTTIDQANQWCPRTDSLGFDPALHQVFARGVGRFTSQLVPSPKATTRKGLILNAAFRLVPGAPSSYGFKNDRKIVCYYSYPKADGGDYALIMESPDLPLLFASAFITLK